MELQEGAKPGSRKILKRRAVPILMVLLIALSVMSVLPTHVSATSAAIAYAPISLTNNQASATPSTFHQQITFNPSSYSSYEAADLGNIRFCSDNACNTPLYAWLESCTSSCAPTATSAIAWVKLTGAIAASGGTLTIYLVFLATSTEFDSNFWGEAPQLSKTYRNYDNGQNVFNFYDDFAGTSLSSNWSTASIGNNVVAVNNGLTISGPNSGGAYGAVVTTGTNSYPQYVDYYQLSYSNTGGSPSIVVEESTGNNYGCCGFGTGYGLTVNGPTHSQIQTYSGSGVNLGGPALPSFTLPSVFSLSWVSTGNENALVNYGGITSATDSSNNIGTFYLSIGNSGGSYSATGVIQWIRLRSYPPSGTMPTFSFGPITPTSAPPVPLYITAQTGGTVAYSYGSTTGTVQSGQQATLNVPSGTAITLQAQPSSGYYFTGWSGAASGTQNPLTLTVTQSSSITAGFAPSTANVTFQVAGVGSDNSGTILTIDGVQYVYQSLPVSETWTVGSTHSVSAAATLTSPTTGKQYVWQSWTNGDGLSGASGTFTTPSSPTTVTVNYQTQYSLYFSANGCSGSNSISPSPQGTPIDQYNSWYNAGTAVTLTAVPAPHCVFTYWTGSGAGSYYSGTANPATITMTGHVTEYGYFAYVYNLALAVGAGGSVTVTSTAINGGLPVTVASGATQAWNVPGGSSITLQAFPQSGYGFSGWSGSLSGATNPISFTISSNMSASAAFQTSTKVSTTTSVLCQPNSFTAGSSTTCAATVTGNNPTGSVSFSSSGSGTFSPANGQCSLTSGACSVTFTTSVAGTQTISATYGGDSNNQGSTGSATITVNAPSKTPTTTTVSCYPSTVATGSPTTCTATVTGSSPTGTIAWGTSATTGSFSPTSCTLSSSACAVTYTDSSAGSPTISASYSGDSNNSPSSGTAVITVKSSASPTTTSASCSPSSLSVGSSTTCSATVTGSNPTGTVSFSASGTGTFSPSSCSLSSGACAVQFVPSSTGTQTITASYGGDSKNLGSSGTSSITVGKGSTRTTVSCSPNPVNTGSTSTCTATVTGYNPTGAVSFATTSSSGTFSPSACTLSSGTCSTSYSDAISGSYTITASYSGDQSNTGSSGTITLNVQSALVPPTTSAFTLVGAVVSATVGGYRGAQVTYTNSYSTSLQAVVFVVFYNSQGQTVAIATGSITIASGGTGTAFVVFPSTIASGTYNVGVMAWSISNTPALNNIPISTITTTALTVT